MSSTSLYLGNTRLSSDQGSSHDRLVLATGILLLYNQFILFLVNLVPHVFNLHTGLLAHYCTRAASKLKGKLEGLAAMKDNRECLRD